jgi:ComF family protein
MPVVAWGIYGGALKRSLAAFKYDNHPELARPLGQWLGQSWLSSTAAKPSSLVAVPIPLHPSKLKQRGFNQAELLAEIFCNWTNLPLARQGLERTVATTPQFGLSAKDRAENLEGAFDLGVDFRRQVPRKRVILIDDIYTTGATIRTAAEVLRRHQISVYGVAVVAIGQQRPKSPG